MGDSAGDRWGFSASVITPARAFTPLGTAVARHPCRPPPQPSRLPTTGWPPLETTMPDSPRWPFAVTPSILASHSGPAAAAATATNWAAAISWAAAASWAAAVLSLAGYVPYLRAVVRARTRPPAAAWLIWAVQQTELAASVRFTATAATGLAFAQAAGTWAVFAWVISRDRWRRPSAWQVPVAVASLAALATWPFAGPAAAAWLLAASEAAGMMLTVTNVWRDPGAEPWPAWMLWSLAGAVTAVGAGAHAPAFAVVYSVWFAAAGLTVAAIAAWRRPHASSPPRYDLLRPLEGKP